MNLALPSGSSPPDEAAGQHHDLALANSLDQCLAAGGNVRRCQVADDQDLRVSTGAGKGLGGIVLTVGAGEHGDDHLGLCHTDLGGSGGVQLAVDLFHGGACLAVGVHRLQLALPDFLQLCHIQRLAAAFKGILPGGLAQQLACGESETISSTMEPYMGSNIRWVGISARILKPMRLPRPILNRASAMPP